MKVAIGTAATETIRLTGVNAIVRALGLALRIVLSRLLGAEAMGVMELSGGIHMLFITPLTSGLPVAVSRLTAKEREKGGALYAGLWLVRRLCWLCIPAMLLLIPPLARWMGDARVLPALYLSVPCVLILGYSAVYNGYCFGTGQSWLPAGSELLEQAARCAIAVTLILLLRGLTVSWAAAVPVFATMIAELLGLCFVLRQLRPPTATRLPDRAVTGRIVRLAAPLTLTRLVTTMLRSAMAILIPLRLQASGLPVAEATARLGMLNGMVIPVTMLPCVFTSALSMVMLPRFAQAEADRARLGALSLRVLGSGTAVWLLCAGAIALLSPFLASAVYRLPELSPLFRAACPLVALSSCNHALAGIIAGLGKQKQGMPASLCSSVLALLLTYWLTALPPLRLYGAVIAATAELALLTAWNACVLLRALRRLKRG